MYIFPVRPLNNFINTTIPVIIDMILVFPIISLNILLLKKWNGAVCTGFIDLMDVLKTFYIFHITEMIAKSAVRKKNLMGFQVRYKNGFRYTFIYRQ